VDGNTLQYFITQGPFAVLFVWLLYSYRKEAHEREERLDKVINDQNQVLSEFSQKYDLIVTKLDGIEERMH
jgi:spermidine synthase